MPVNHAELGAWNVYCDRCRRKYKNYELKKEWTGLMVCDTCWDPRHPQDYPQRPREEPKLPYTRPVRGEIDGSPDYTTAGVLETSVPSGTFDDNNNTL